MNNDLFNALIQRKSREKVCLMRSIHLLFPSRTSYSRSRMEILYLSVLKNIYFVGGKRTRDWQTRDHRDMINPSLSPLFSLSLVYTSNCNKMIMQARLRHVFHFATRSLNTYLLAIIIYCFSICYDKCSFIQKS